ncbi:MAG: TolC family protein [Bacteroidetes bacterium]|nr:TolC family protein [Bacteroidota bacterium]
MMRHNFIRSLVLLFWLLVQFPAHAQDNSMFDPVKDEISSNLPPLNVLLDSALSYNHYIHFRDLQLIVNKCKLQSSQVEWTRYIGMQANLGYGNFYSYSSSSSDGIQPINAAGNRSETKYSGTLYLNMPFNALVNRRNLVRLAKTEIEQAESMAEVQRDETRQLVIRQYNDLILKQRLFRIKSKYRETARMSFQMVEQEFLNGVIPITEYARQSDAASRAETDYESARMDFLTSYMILEEIVGMKFNLTTQMSGANEGH